MKYFIKEVNGDATVAENRSMYSDEELVSEFGYVMLESEYENICDADFNGCDFSNEKYQARIIESEKRVLRRRREIECFSIVNRGFFFDGATAEELADIKNWYKAWLDVTIVPFVTPELPEILKTKTKQ